jgi:hypothetical protein
MNIWYWIGIWFFYCIQAVVANQNNKFGGKWLWIAIVYSALPVFPLVCKVSKNLMVDGIIYDVLIFLSYVVTLLYLGSGKAFSFWNWAGLALVIGGVVLMKAKV